MATVYHRDQAGAPALTVSTSANNVAQFTAFKTVLKACLVTGFGAQPAAGWELINEGTNFIILRNGSHSGYVCFTWAAGVITVWLAYTYTGVTSNVIDGDGKKTGIAENNGVPQRIGCYTLVYSDAAYSWSMIADADTFILNWTGYSSAPELGSASGNYFVSCIYVGDDSSGNFISIGGTNAATASGSWVTPQANFNATGFTALRNPGTGLLVDAGGLSISTPGLQLLLSNNINTSMPLQQEVSLAPAYWYGAGVAGGRLRGIALIPQMTFVSYKSIAAIALGISAGMTIRTSNALIPLGDGHSYLIGHAYSLHTLFLLTDNLDFW